MNILRALLVCGCAMLLGIAGAAAQGVEPQVIIQTPVVPYIGGAAIGSGNPAPVTCISGCASPVVASSGGSAVLAVGAASANVALPASVTSFPTLLLVNNGTVDLFYNVGVGAGTAATTSPSATNLKLPAGRAIQIAPATTVTYVAAILASGSIATELDIYQLTAPSLIAGGGGSAGGGGGSVTQGTSPWVVGVPTWAGGTLGAMANYGTSPGAVLVPGFNAFITNSVAVTQATASNLKAQIDPLTSSSWGLGAFGFIMPGNGQGVGLFDGTNMVRAKGDETNGIWVNVKAGAGSGGTAIADAGTFTASTTSFTPIGGQFTSGGATACVSGHACWAGMTADRSVFVNLMDYAGAAISTSNPIPVTGVGVANGAAFASQTFSAVMGLASTNAPTATAGGLWALSISPASGGVRVDFKDTPSNTNPFAVTLPTTPTIAAGNGVVLAPTSAAAGALSHVSSTSAGVTSLVGKASAGNLYAYNCTAISGATAGYCVAYNGTAAPSTGALTAANVLDYCYFGASAAGCSLSRIPMAVQYGTGIVVIITSAATPYTYTTGTDTGAITIDYN